MKARVPVIGYTNYPLWLSAIPFEDRVNKQLPWPEGEPTVYQVELVSYDNNKYAVVKHEKYGVVEFKRFYIFPTRKMYGRRRNGVSDLAEAIPRRTFEKKRFVDAIVSEDYERLGVVCI